MKAIEIKGLTKRFGQLYALKDLNLDVNPGEVLGYLGPNGSGKTTTIRLMLGMIKPTAGQATLFGLDSQTQKEQAHENIAYVPGEANLWPFLTGMETLHLLAKVHGSVDKDYRDRLIKQFDLDPNKKVRTYSKGNKQKINLIAALASRAKLLILDEPTSGLDPLMEQAFREAINEARGNGQTVFLSSHILQEVETLCDRIAVLRLGKLVELGTLAEMRHLSSLTIEAGFSDKPPDITAIKGVSDVQVQGHQLQCQITGSVDELLQVLAKAHPIRLLSREPSLEELFLAIYGETEA